MKNNDIYYYLAFSHFLGIGPIKFEGLIKYFGLAEEAYRANKRELEQVIGINLTNRFIDFRSGFDPLKKLEELNKKEIKVIPNNSKDYPEALKKIEDPPICLYVRGKLNSATDFFSRESLSHAKEAGSLSKVKKNPNALFNFAIVGTRLPTSYGCQVAYKFAYELASAGFTIVSGMAMGIDAIAHRACLDKGQKTIAILGCGVDIIYPAINYKLYQDIIEKGGSIISEFPPGQTVLKGLFIARNRIISGLSMGVLVVEGGEHSGALITAKYAAEQGKEVFAVPSSINSKMAQAPNLLLKEGARLVSSIDDILEEFNIRVTPKKKENILTNLSDKEKEIYLILSEKPILINDLVHILKKPVNEILKTLSLMEINEVIEKNQENYYQVKL